MSYNNYKIILASNSPRRKELLSQVGIDFSIYPSDFNEDSFIDNNVDLLKTPMHFVMELAKNKAKSVFTNLSIGSNNIAVIGADTVVSYNNKILGKPKNKFQATEYLEMLSGNTHQVYTGVSIHYNKDNITHSKTFYSLTDVTFYDLTSEEIQNYIDKKESFDKAGGYGIQGLGALLVEKINGDYNNVVGLPVNSLVKVLNKILY